MSLNVAQTFHFLRRISFVFIPILQACIFKRHYMYYRVYQNCAQNWRKFSVTQRIVTASGAFWY